MVSESRRSVCSGRRQALLACAGAVLGTVAPSLARAAHKPQRLVVAGVAGATTDTLARLLGDGLARQLGQSVIVDPRPGASGAIAVNDLLAAPRDGHTALVAVNSVVSEVPHILRMKVDVAKAIVPLAELARGGLVLVATPSLPANTLPELIAYARARRAALSYASYSTGTMSHILGLQLARAAGIDLVHVGYRGSSPALVDVMAGHVPLMFDALPSSLPLLRAGKIKALGISTPARSPHLPQVPTFAELGFAELETVPWLGLWVAAGVVPSEQARLRDMALDVMSGAQMREKLAELGFERGQPRATEELRQALHGESQRVGAVLASIGFKPE